MTRLEELIRCEKWITDALAYSGDTHDFEHVVSGVLLGNMQFWPNKDCCLITEFHTFPKKRVLHIFLAGGDLDQLLSMHPAVMEWAKANGCSDLTESGRKGWTKVLKKHGWKESFTTMSRAIL